MTTEEDYDFEDAPPSKSQRKREMQELKNLAVRLTELSTDTLEKIEPPELRDAIVAGTKIHRGSARKRQMQFIAKMLSRMDVEPIVTLVDEIDAGSAAYVKKFHQLERWREQLIAGDQDTMNAICAQFPEVDRQQLRQAIRQATAEHKRGEQGTAFRKLFQFLKALED